MGKKMLTLFNRIVLYGLLGVYKITFGLYIRLFYRLSCTNRNFPKKGPYLLLANHCNNFDGLFLQCLIHTPIHFVVTDSVFKKRWLARILYFAGYIPKRKSVSDSKAIRQIIRTIKKGGIVGIFPEGGRSWDGKTGSLSPATFRLIQLLGVPVVTARIKGSYLSQPRWADTKRRGRVEVEFNTLFGDGAKRSLDVITRSVTEALSHHEADWQRNKCIPFKGKALSKGLERLLFVCPACGKIGTLTSYDDHADCGNCGTVFTADVYGYIHANEASLSADNATGLDEYQKHLLKEAFAHAADGETLLCDEGACLYTAQNADSSFEPLDEGTLTLTGGVLRLGCHCFDLAALSGLSVYFKSHLEFRYGGQDYRIGFRETRVSAYKWCCALETIKGM